MQQLLFNARVKASVQRPTLQGLRYERLVKLSHLVAFLFVWSVVILAHLCTAVVAERSTMVTLAQFTDVFLV